MITYVYTYTDHTNDIGDWCSYSGTVVPGDVIDVTDPNADDDEITCPQDCADSAIERYNEDDESNVVSPADLDVPNQMTDRLVS